MRMPRIIYSQHSDKIRSIRIIFKMPRRQLIGEVTSNKMQKTVVIRAERIKEHPKYKKRYKVHKKYKAHDEKNEYHAGDKVIIEECRPLSKEKRWRVVGKIENRK